MSKELENRTKKFALSIIDLVENFEYSISKKVIITQLVRSTTSVAANYRATSRARSDKEFVAKLNIVVEETDESLFWLEIIKDKKWKNVENEIKEATELTSIFVTMLKNKNIKIKKDKLDK